MEIYKKAFGMLCWMLFSMALMKVTNGYYGIVLTFLGVCFALARKVGWAICHYALLFSMVIINPIVLPKEGYMWALSLRFGPLFIGLALVLMSFRNQGSHRIPLGGMLPFLFVACISSSDGWVPQISYVKLLNFFVFLMGIWLGVQNLSDKPSDVIKIRALFLAFAVFFIAGSIVLIPFPNVSYLSALLAYREDGAFAAMEAAHSMQEAIKSGSAGGYEALFCGITYQSQTLAPVVALLFAWVFCDMLFVEKRVRWLHLGLMLVALPLLFMTRSRVAFVTLVSGICVIYFYAAKKIKLPFDLQNGIKRIMSVFFAFMIIGAIVAEINGQTITRWMRKTNDVEGDSRDFTEAFTESRMGLVEQSMYEFERSPVLGSGFQVSENHVYMMQHSDGLILSAPIEKGLLPLMVLGETGIVGAICFVFFLISFYVTAVKRRLFVTITLFAVFFMANFGEATFFSPGGMGGVLWLVSFVGGFVIDTILLNENINTDKV